MINKPKDFLFLVDAFKSLPSVGTKNATRYAYHIIKADQTYIDEFIERIIKAKKNLKYCDICHNISTTDICNICSDDKRNNSLLIVCNIADLDKIEEMSIHHGYYHVLHGEINPKQGINDKNLFINDINDHIKKYQIDEVLIATPFSVSGEITAEYIKNKLSYIKDINIYRIGFGLPTNASIDYADEQTIKYALINKRKIG